MNLVVAPFWLAMILLPQSAFVRRISHPFFAPALVGVVYLYAVYLLVTVTGVPRLAGLELKSVRLLVSHPLVFLAVWAHYLAINLFVGMSLFRHAVSRRIDARVELVLCWLVGPVGLMAYVLRLGWLKATWR